MDCMKLQMPYTDFLKEIQIPITLLGMKEVSSKEFPTYKLLLNVDTWLTITS
jgi:hypothetical protein